MKVISFVNMKGGVGKTTLAVNVADTINRRHGLSVLLVDLDPQFNATQCLFSGEEYVAKLKGGHHTIVDIFDDNARITFSPIVGQVSRQPTRLEDVAPWQVREGFDLIAGNLEIYRVEMAPGQGKELRLKRYLEKIASDKYDIVIIDTPPTPSHYMIAALLASSHFLVPVKPEPLSRVGIDLLQGVIRRCTENHGHEIACAGVVLTLADIRTRVYKEALQILDADPYWKDRRYKGILPHRTSIARDQGNQGLILDGEISGRTAVAQITSELLARLS